MSDDHDTRNARERRLAAMDAGELGSDHFMHALLGLGTDREPDIVTQLARLTAHARASN